MLLTRVQTRVASRSMGRMRLPATALHTTQRSIHAHVVSILGRDESKVLGELRSQLDHVRRQPVPQGGWTMLYAVDKHLSPTNLQQAVALLRSSESVPDVHARVGALTASWPASALARSTQGDLACISMAFLPASKVVAFQSKIQGKPAVAVGRWQPLDVQRQRSLTPKASKDEGPPENIWSQTNREGALPPALQPLLNRVAGTVILSDAAPQGLIEGLKRHFPFSLHLGLVAPPTPFETGRDRTLFFDQDGVHEIFEQGSVGVALLSDAAAHGGELKIQSAYANLHPMGSRRTLTKAEGNVISSLDGDNAVDQFRKAIEARPIKRPDHECVFRVGVYRDGATDPAVMATIVGGQSSRGALLLNSDVNLGDLLQGSQSISIQFFQEDPDTQLTPSPPTTTANNNLRILFANPGSGDSSPCESWKEASNTEVVTWTGTFAVSSPEGWFQRCGTKVPGSAIWMDVDSAAMEAAPQNAG